MDRVGRDLAIAATRAVARIAAILRSSRRGRLGSGDDRPRRAAADRRGAARPPGGARNAYARGARRPARRRQDHARSAGADGRALGEGRPPDRARASPPRRPRRRRADGCDLERKGWRDDRPARAAPEPGLGAAPASRSSPKACSQGRSSTIPRSTASRACCSTSSTSARSTPTSDWRWRSTRRRRCARTCVSSSCRRRSTARGCARLLGDAPLIESQGRAFPVVTRYVGRDPRARIEDEVARATLEALDRETGSALVFLPGQGEIRRVAETLEARIRRPDVDIAPLYGALDPRAQDRAVEPAPPGRRKIVLATSIAETSLTIEGVRIVIDSGLMRVPRYEPDIGLTRLETVRVSRANADQRRGRAGRVEPGVCVRLWEEAATGGLQAYAAPEILIGRPLRLPARLRGLGRDRSDAARLSRSAAARRAQRGARAARRDRRARRRRPRHRRGPGNCAPRPAAAARPHGGRRRPVGRGADGGRGRRHPDRTRPRRRRGRPLDPARRLPPRPVAPRRGRAPAGARTGAAGGGGPHPFGPSPGKPADRRASDAHGGEGSDPSPPSRSPARGRGDWPCCSPPPIPTASPSPGGSAASS